MNFWKYSCISNSPYIILCDGKKKAKLRYKIKEITLQVQSNQALSGY